MKRDAALGWIILFVVVVLWALHHETSTKQKAIDERLEELNVKQMKLDDEQAEIDDANATNEEDLQRMKNQVQELEEAAANAKRLR